MMAYILLFLIRHYAILRFQTNLKRSFDFKRQILSGKYNGLKVRYKIMKSYMWSVAFYGGLKKN